MRPSEVVNGDAALAEAAEAEADCSEAGELLTLPLVAAADGLAPPASRSWCSWLLLISGLLNAVLLLGSWPSSSLSVLWPSLSASSPRHAASCPEPDEHSSVLAAVRALVLGSPFSSPPPPLRLPSECVVSVYANQQALEDDWVFGVLSSSLPAACGCGVRWRLPGAFAADYEAHSGRAFVPHADSLPYPCVWVVSTPRLLRNSTGMSEVLAAFCLTDPQWCSRNVLLVHIADELRINPMPYAAFHSVFRQYHKPNVSDYSYLLRPLLSELGYSEESMQREDGSGQLSTPAAAGSQCPELATRFIWKEASETVQALSSNWSSGGGAQLPARPEDLPSHRLQQLHAAVWQRVNASRLAAQHCHMEGLLRFFRQEQARVSVAPERAHVFWMPCGHGSGLLSFLPSGALATSVRRLLWAWSGSVRTVVERQALQLGLQPPLSPQQQAVMQRGAFLAQEGFAAGPKGVAYTSLMVDSAFVPIPSGNVPEQFRIHELLEAGAFPVMTELPLLRGPHRSPPYLSYMRDLALDPLLISDYSAFLAELHPVTFFPPQLLDAWQRALSRRHQLLIHGLTSKFAERTCLLLGRTTSTVQR